jgi:DHA2 family multidrug resistance protein
MALTIIPLTTMAAQALGVEEMPHGIAINNMMRQLGGAFGIAVINNIINQRYAFHRNDLVCNMVANNPQFVQRNINVIQALHSKLAVTSFLPQQSLYYMDLVVTKQAYMLTYLDSFLISSVCVLSVIPLLFFMKGSIFRKSGNSVPSDEIS